METAGLWGGLWPPGLLRTGRGSPTQHVKRRGTVTLVNRTSTLSIHTHTSLSCDIEGDIFTALGHPVVGAHRNPRTQPPPAGHRGRSHFWTVLDRAESWHVNGGSQLRRVQFWEMKKNSNA